MLPAGQQFDPHDVVPEGHAHWPLAQTSLALQQELPQACGVADGQHSAPPPHERPLSQKPPSHEGPAGPPCVAETPSTQPPPEQTNPAGQHGPCGPHTTLPAGQVAATVAPAQAPLAQPSPAGQQVVPHWTPAVQSACATHAPLVQVEPTGHAGVQVSPAAAAQQPLPQTTEPAGQQAPLPLQVPLPLQQPPVDDELYEHEGPSWQKPPLPCGVPTHPESCAE